MEIKNVIGNQEKAKKMEAKSFKPFPLKVVLEKVKEFQHKSKLFGVLLQVVIKLINTKTDKIKNFIYKVWNLLCYTHNLFVFIN